MCIFICFVKERKNDQVYKVSSPLSGHMPYSGQFRSTDLQSYLNVFMICCLFEQSEGFKLLSNNEFYSLKVIKLSLEWPWSDVIFDIIKRNSSQSLYFIKHIPFNTNHSKNHFISVTICLEKILIVIFEDFGWKYICSLYSIHF